ncbi:hypothetical protein DFR50_10186 [Roseiarcus fermentans]|uniref:Uncharacterized protein n=1 Tax=Roseiarcus fermentans TaxID=1473586 RepID=A0A366FTY4_9HYPH|nr:hypothetical protein DFR50_10186 [Roseiarcus fermentans]
MAVTDLAIGRALPGAIMIVSHAVASLDGSKPLAKRALPWRCGERAACGGAKKDPRGRRLSRNRTERPPAMRGKPPEGRWRQEKTPWRPRRPRRSRKRKRARTPSPPSRANWRKRNSATRRFKRHPMAAADARTGRSLSASTVHATLAGRLGAGRERAPASGPVKGRPGPASATAEAPRLAAWGAASKGRARTRQRPIRFLPVLGGHRSARADIRTVRVETRAVKVRLARQTRPIDDPLEEEKATVLRRLAQR